MLHASCYLLYKQFAIAIFSGLLMQLELVLAFLKSTLLVRSHDVN